ncbi:DUF4435 domain-containing protein [Synechococcus elongatus]|uniref:DUF4435 domain-containing protein n=2 Tax=Synechococcus elongatus TaxID=32046 RepID=Q31RV7_SYNE7|nr:DUF4435 domain-containing protein [Synechococcus elongatus]MBD2689112.1 DUF4435 domain-containing protein [Synechococcus elongatus FACHB-1061]ABB56212.1 conserved hypothetical protein [Synechococcus elongatus PCC 7942 = FACHB-805]AJD56737.1 hypothetical protein M744_02155 [Synechococcus elongatus UTEX 2973]MBD2588044.1 DUF4435 domain-containing protein [Synechococcus elongatus FACHB-242]MBD2707248.1 DUF4435 domain-containing protein [Synechococcus elongatus PCC 7942 = FACHB-805]
MKDLLSNDRHANQIRLRRSTFQGTFLLVEGSSDKIFYENLIDQLECEVVNISGKPSSKLLVISVLKILEKRPRFNGILAIVDADFDRLANLQPHSSNLLYTDTHDLESMIINSPAFYKVIAEYGSKNKIHQFNRDIRVAILESGTSIGYLLWISQCNELNLTFKGIRFSRFIDENSLQIDEIELIREIKNKSQAFSLDDEDLRLQLNDKKDNGYDPWQVCCGHHLVEILSLGLRRTLGSNQASDIEPDKLERYLRLAYEEKYFLNTDLYASIRNWEDNNMPFKVLKNDRS